MSNSDFWPFPLDLAAFARDRFRFAGVLLELLPFVERRFAKVVSLPTARRVYSEVPTYSVRRREIIVLGGIMPPPRT